MLPHSSSEVPVHCPMICVYLMGLSVSLPRKIVTIVFMHKAAVTVKVGLRLESVVRFTIRVSFTVSVRVIKVAILSCNCEAT